VAVAPVASYREGMMHGYGKGRERKGHGLAGGVAGWFYLALPLPPFSFFFPPYFSISFSPFPLYVSMALPCHASQEQCCEEGRLPCVSLYLLKGTAW